MDMELVRSCPKCRGNLYRYLSRYDGWHEECFQCGYHVPTSKEIEDKAKLLQPVSSQPT